MGHIFISYSHKDSKYAHALADQLHGMGIEVWIDERLDYGSQWPHEIQKQLDTCDAFLPVMSPRSFASDWVQSELQRAKRKLKPIFPLLLEGDEPWLSVESTQYYDVRGETFPDAKFYSALKRVISVGPKSDTFSRLPKPSAVTQVPQVSGQRGILIAGLGGASVLLVACLATVVILLFRPWDRQSPSPDPTQTADVEVQPSVVKISETVEVEATLTPRAATDTPPPTLTRPPSGTCKDGYVFRSIDSSDKVCVPPASKAQAAADTAEADSHWARSALVNAYGQNACAYGYVWRNLYEGDVVCVTPERYQEYQQENADSPSYKQPGSEYCITGFVWRDAFPFDGDLVCVTPASRTEAQNDNNQSASYTTFNYYDDDDCIPGYVPRKAFAGDLVCVTPEAREQVIRDNAEAPQHTWP